MLCLPPQLYRFINVCKTPNIRKTTDKMKIFFIQTLPARELDVSIIEEAAKREARLYSKSRTLIRIVSSQSKSCLANTCGHKSSQTIGALGCKSRPAITTTASPGCSVTTRTKKQIGFVMVAHINRYNNSNNTISNRIIIIIRDYQRGTRHYFVVVEVHIIIKLRECANGHNRSRNLFRYCCRFLFYVYCIA